MSATCSTSNTPPRSRDTSYKLRTRRSRSVAACACALKPAVSWPTTSITASMNTSTRLVSSNLALASAVPPGGGALRPLRQVDLALLQAQQQLVGRHVHHHHLVGLVEDAAGTVSQTRMPVMPLTMSFRLSRCCTFIVVQTSIPASCSSFTPCQRLGWREPGASTHATWPRCRCSRAFPPGPRAPRDLASARHVRRPARRRSCPRRHWRRRKSSACLGTRTSSACTWANNVSGSGRSPAIYSQPARRKRQCSKPAAAAIKPSASG